ncbi:MAG: hypothetical protein COB93_05365 [Sneathiella sp.]|nr:MAG: hypothetical protein COB93_05365 [Sneathiella sp.]
MKILSIVLMLAVSVNLLGCATERTASGDTIESGTINYQISEEELEKYLSKQERITFFGSFLPNDAVENKFLMKFDRKTTESFVLASLDDVGRLYKKKETDGVLEIVGTVRSGYLNMSKAALWIELEEKDNFTAITILAIAFEGIIKQNTVGKAIERLVMGLEEISGQKVERR